MNSNGNQTLIKREVLAGLEEAEEKKPRIVNDGGFGSMPFSAEETVAIQDLLDTPLSKKETCNRPGPGGTRLTYIEGWKVIYEANRVFGFNGWSSKVLSIDVRYIEETAAKRFNACVCATVRITLRDGCSREDRGGGICEGMRSKGDALLKAEKEAVTDAYKRALKNFGLRLGLSLYDREHVRGLNRQPAAVAPNARAYHPGAFPGHQVSPITPAAVTRRPLSAPGITPPHVPQQQPQLQENMHKVTPKLDSARAHRQQSLGRLLGQVPGAGNVAVKELRPIQHGVSAQQANSLTTPRQHGNAGAPQQGLQKMRKTNGSPHNIGSKRPRPAEWAPDKNSNARARLAQNEIDELSKIAFADF